jgi:predicted RNase H-like HicB family nuclease
MARKRNDGAGADADSSAKRLRGRQAAGKPRARALREMPDDSPGSRGRGPASGNASRNRTGPGAVSGEEVASVKRYRVVLERDESGAWIATVPKVRGCHTYGRSLVEAKRRIRPALGLWVDGAFELDLDVRLPREALAAITESRAARANAESARVRAASNTQHAVRELVERVGLGVRDAADLLGLSHQRVQQLLETSRTVS